jgi:hypothetical protein
LYQNIKRITMNKEFSHNNYQDHPHQEGQQQNIAHHGQGRGVNEPPTMNEGKSENTRRQEGEEGRSEEREEGNGGGSRQVSGE